MLLPAAWIYQGVTGIRNWVYDHNWRKALSVNARVISVGNVTTGGTGKTPVTLALIDWLKSHGHSCGVVSRGYLRSKKGVHAVEVGPTAANEFGDEPVLIKSLHKEIPVVVGERRILAARQLLETQPVEFIVCDDGFQHRRLKRDLNLLLLDATEDFVSYRLLPVGRGRESLLPALRRADYFVLTKTNLATAEQLKELIYWLKQKSEKPVLLAAYVFRGFYSATGQKSQTLRDPAYLISGVAKPHTLEKLLGDRVKIVKHKAFSDHHRYTYLEVESILDEASRLQARWILTTAKDATKLGAFLGLRERLWVIDMGVEFEGDTEAFYADLDRLARESH